MRRSTVYTTYIHLMYAHMPQGMYAHDAYISLDTILLYYLHIAGSSIRRHLTVISNQAVKVLIQSREKKCTSPSSTIT